MERWKEIPDFPDYAVSDHGRVKRLTSRTCARAGSILRACARSKDRPYLSVDLCANGKRRTEMVHILVARAFLDPVPFAGAEVNHIDGDKTNPHFENLEWVTSSGNSLHAYAAGLADAKGEANGQAKLTAAQVLEIRALSSGRRGEQAALARQFGVTDSAIRSVLSRKTWSHI
ncbi:HNH endonuclease [Burkholderia sp. BDU5]|nr:HNH endonuclease [Burkholderia sp. BDU5]